MSKLKCVGNLYSPFKIAHAVAVVARFPKSSCKLPLQIGASSARKNHLQCISKKMASFAVLCGVVYYLPAFVLHLHQGDAATSFLSQCHMQLPPKSSVLLASDKGEYFVTVMISFFSCACWQRSHRKRRHTSHPVFFKPSHFCWHTSNCFHISCKLICIGHSIPTLPAAWTRLPPFFWRPA